ncbi:MAG: hypothetical protein HYZ73_09695 [Elusimicrobia bacterium]|nr:hypothetical protein [Elusimicrobiota bacterium]
MSERIFRYTMSPRCFRYKEEAILNHAPESPGVFEFVTFDAAGQAKVLYLGLAHRNMAEALRAHLQGVQQPSVEALLQRYPDLYFDYVEWSDAQGPEDLQDLAAALSHQCQPPHNPEPLAFTDRYQQVKLQEIELPMIQPH